MVRHRNAGRVWDISAAALSSACILHCLALPLLATMLPLASQLVDSHLAHVIMVSLAIPVTLWVVLSEGLTGFGRIFTPIALTGLALMLTAVTALEEFEVPLTLVGGTLLGGAHVWRWLRQHKAVETPSVEEG